MTEILNTTKGSLLTMSEKETNEHVDEAKVLEVMEKMYSSLGEESVVHALKDQVHELEQRVDDTEKDIEDNSEELGRVIGKIDRINERINTLETSIDTVRQMTQDSATAKSRMIEQIIILAVGGLITAVASQIVR